MGTAPIRLSLIAAIDRNRLIGIDGERMPWHLPDDLRHFKQQTLGKPIIMGRRTFESIGRPLPGRLNIVLTRGSGVDAIAGQLEIAADLTAAQRLAEAWIRQPSPGKTAPQAPAEVMVIGGAQVYEQSIDHADRLYLTEIDAEFAGNNFFPPYRQMSPGWIEIERDSRLSQTDGSPDFAFVTYDRIR